MIGESDTEEFQPTAGTYVKVPALLSLGRKRDHQQLYVVLPASGQSFSNTTRDRIKSLRTVL